jgi:hypothetical protein
MSCGISGGILVGGGVAIEQCASVLREDGCGVETSLRDDYIREVFGDSEEGGGAGDDGSVEGACAAHGDGEDVGLKSWPMAAEGVAQSGVMK